MPGLLSLAVRSSWVLVALLFNTYSQAAEVEIVTGEHWVKSTPELKKAYLIGVANVLQIERAYHGKHNNPPSDSQEPHSPNGERIEWCHARWGVTGARCLVCEKSTAAEAAGDRSHLVRDGRARIAAIQVAEDMR
jgi:hypothetical protein